eukprot:jgi/Tetstr1/458139/TSEL_044631.t1
MAFAAPCRATLGQGTSHPATATKRAGRCRPSSGPIPARLPTAAGRRKAVRGEPSVTVVTRRSKLQLAQAVEQGRAASSEAPTAADGGYTVLVTGSTKGIGRALAEEFLSRGDRVVITSRDASRVAETVRELAAAHGAGRVAGLACNVSKGSDVTALADFATQRFGQVDIWVNNAGTNAYYYGPLADAADSDLASIVETNVLGVMLCCREAIRVMKAQPGGGHIFNMDGAGADGSPTPRFAAYGATKRGLQQFSKSLQAELKTQGAEKVVVHNLSPGMVTTELLMSGANTPQAKWFINCLAEPAEDVATFLVPRMRQVLSSAGNGNGGAQPTYIQYLTKPKAFSQIFGRALFGLRKNRWVKED